MQTYLENYRMGKIGFHVNLKTSFLIFFFHNYNKNHNDILHKSYVDNHHFLIYIPKINIHLIFKRKEFLFSPTLHLGHC